MKSFEEFQQYFDMTIKEALEDIEKRRSNMHYWRHMLGIIGGALLLIHWTFVALDIIPSYTMIPTLLAIPAVAYFIYQRVVLDTSIPDDYKETVVKQMIHFVDPSLNYQAENYIKYEVFKESELFLLKPDHYIGDDYIDGTIGGVGIQVSELEVMLETQGMRQKKPRWNTLFHGIFLVATTSQSYSGKTFILSDNLYKRMGYAGMLVQMNNLVRGHYIQAENIQFRKNFVVYAENALEGKELLTEELMESLLVLKKKSHCPVYVSLIGHKVYVAVDLRKDVFKVDINKPLFDARFVRSFYDELYYILGIVRDLGLGEFPSPTSGPENHIPMDQFSEPPMEQEHFDFDQDDFE
ncbi:DUF3137 domain-containing protein [Rapidithrix thailandica]|uniref:DUF3137 domain-containing protein n=1 Tax=Rapidithrix thailandica TaxID=413964 RepID=A0AAW9SAY7_9BACT